MNLLATYPRVRPELSLEWKEIYERTYKDSREGKSFIYFLTQKLEQWMHQSVRVKGQEKSLLEIGAGTLNHVRFESSTISYDVVEPFKVLYEGRPELTRLGSIYGNINEIPKTIKYDKIISIAVLEHIENLPKVIANVGLLLSDSGAFESGIPSEGSFLWGMGWRVSAGLRAKIKYGLDYGELMRHEHLSNALEIIEVVNYFFSDVKVSRFPLPMHHLSLYASINASSPRIDRCKEWAS